MKAAIVFFSRAGENYVSGAIKDLAVGNTRVAAEMVQRLTGADLIEIEPLIPYSNNYSTCIEEARQEQRRDARPEMKSSPESMAAYDTIYLGYPNYWGTMPMVLFTFLGSYDFTGKTIKPFCTHEGSGLGKSEADIARLCPGATVAPGLALHGTRVHSAKAAIAQWISIDCVKN